MEIANVKTLEWNDAKYLIAYIAPLAGFLGIYWGGYWSFGSMYVGFVMIPFLELFTPNSTKNFSEPVEAQKKHSRFFDFLLYLNLPILYALIAYYLITLQTATLSNLELVGMTLNVGLIVGTIGINVAHELGHRANKFEQRLAQSMLLSGLYMHFFIEHNRGHHKNVATRKDPASARKGEWIYFFWFRSTIGGYINAWKLEAKRLKQKGLPFWHPSNQMLQFQLIQLAYLSLIGFIFGWELVPFAIAIAIVGFLLLESVNYIEHYGLSRKILPSGKPEKVQPHHSWNSDHELGRIFLYELTRHSDHHFKASRKYQILRHWEDSPQLPMGYPGAILTALIPPVWFYVMHKHI